MPDINIKCVDCGKDFVWTESGQRFFQEKGFSKPKRCRDCKQKKRDEFDNREETRSKPVGYR